MKKKILTCQICNIFGGTTKKRPHPNKEYDGTELYVACDICNHQIKKLNNK